MRSSTSNSDTPNPDGPALKGGFPFALAAALLAFGVCERLVWNWRPWLEFCARYTPPWEAADPLRTSARIRLLPTNAPQPPVLLIGSSQIEEGLDCAAFEARFPGRHCSNLGVAAGSPLDVLFQTDRVDRRLRRRTVITGVFPSTIHTAPKPSFSDLRTLRCLVRSGAWFHMTTLEWIDVIYGELQNVSETLRAKRSLEDLWAVVGEEPLAALRWEIPPQPPRVLDPREPLPRWYFRSQMGNVNPLIAPGRFTRAHEMALDEVIEREARQGNFMIVIDFPTRHGYETMITTEAIEHHHRLIERLAARRDVVVVRSTDLPPLEDRDFHDFTHLRASGRRKVSERVAEILALVGG
jgi:hypothetical protein